MKKIVSLILVVALLLTACGTNERNIESTEVSKEIETVVNLETIATKELVYDDEYFEYIERLNFTGLSDPELLQFIEDDVYANLSYQLGSEDYIVEEINAIYLSKEYLEDLEHNSQSNIFFGYSLDELEKEFEGKKFEFAMGDNGETIVREFEEYDDTYEQVLKNVAIGVGVIIVLVVVTVVTYGSDVPAIASVCAISGAAAKGAAIGAVSGALVSGTLTGVLTGVQTGDIDEALKAAALKGSEGFKWGAISGAISGGATKAIQLRNAAKAAGAVDDVANAAKSIPNARESELAALSKYGGKEQVSYLAGKEVAYNTYGSTRPDIVRTLKDGTLEAIEVKNYNLANSANRSEMYSELVREISARVENMPEGTVQRIVLDVTNRGYATELIESVKTTIWEKLANIYADIPIDIMG